MEDERVDLKDMDRDEFAQFLVRLANSAQETPEAWENATVPDFLRAWAGWISDMDGYFLNSGQDAPQGASWQLIAQSLLAARVYE